MKAHEHAAVAAEFELALARLDPAADGQLYIWFLMHAATQRLNAALHALNWAKESDDQGRCPRDIVHSDDVADETARSPGVALMVASLRYLEDLRGDFVRGPKLLDGATRKRARAAYEKIRHLGAESHEPRATS